MVYGIWDMGCRVMVLGWRRDVLSLVENLPQLLFVVERVHYLLRETFPWWWCREVWSWVFALVGDVVKLVGELVVFRHVGVVRCFSVLYLFLFHVVRSRAAWDCEKTKVVRK
jgi:hypothetical protein